jgi:hypothetical protein
MKQKREIVIKEVTSSHDQTIILDQQLRYISETEARNLSTLNLGCHILVSLHHLSPSSNSKFLHNRASCEQHQRVSNIIKHNRTSSSEQHHQA